MSGIKKEFIDQPELSAHRCHTPAAKYITLNAILEQLNTVAHQKYADIDCFVTAITTHVNLAIDQAESLSLQELSASQRTSLENLQIQFISVVSTIQQHWNNCPNIQNRLITIINEIRPDNIWKSAQDLKAFVISDFQGYVLAQGYYDFFFGIDLTIGQFIYENAPNSEELKETLVSLANTGRKISSLVFDVVRGVHDAIENLNIHQINSIIEKKVKI